MILIIMVILVVNFLLVLVIHCCFFTTAKVKISSGKASFVGQILIWWCRWWAAWFEVTSSKLFISELLELFTNQSLWFFLRSSHASCNLSPEKDVVIRLSFNLQSSNQNIYRNSWKFSLHSFAASTLAGDSSFGSIQLIIIHSKMLATNQFLRLPANMEMTETRKHVFIMSPLYPIWGCKKYGYLTIFFIW